MKTLLIIIVYIILGIAFAIFLANIIYKLMLFFNVSYPVFWSLVISIIVVIISNKLEKVKK